MHRQKIILLPLGARDSLVIKALGYKPEGRGFETLQAAVDPGVYSASNINEYRKHKKNNVSGE
jgi:hypothetical protein